MSDQDFSNITNENSSEISSDQNCQKKDVDDYKFLIFRLKGIQESISLLEKFFLKN